LGSVGAALNKEALKSLGITHILIVATSLSPAFPAEFNYKKIEGNSYPLFFSSYKICRDASIVLRMQSRTID
jgi:hypothetical protein